MDDGRGHGFWYSRRDLEQRRVEPSHNLTLHFVDR